MRLVAGVGAALALAAFAGSAAAQESDPYTSAVADLGTRLAALSAQAVEVNEAWEARDVSFADTSDAFRSIVTEAGNVFDEIQLLTPPDDLSSQHEAMVNSAEQSAAAAQAMLDGLNDPNDANARRTATDQFIVVASEFVALTELVTAPPATTTTTSTTTSTTTTTTAPVATTSPPVTAALPAAPAPEVVESDGSGAETPLLVLIGLLAGLLVGLTGGLLVGRRARRNLIDALQRARAGGAPPA